MKERENDKWRNIDTNTERMKRWRQKGRRIDSGGDREDRERVGG